VAERRPPHGDGRQALEQQAGAGTSERYRWLRSLARNWLLKSLGGLGELVNATLA